MASGATLLERFWCRVAVDPRPGACWRWLGSHKGKGERYGQIYRGDDRLDGAHRVAWELWYGEIPKGAFVRHLCDNPGCVRPTHLAIGSHQDNMADRVRRILREGLGHPGVERCPERIRDLRARGFSFRQIGKKIGISGARAHQLYTGIHY